MRNRMSKLLKGVKTVIVFQFIITLMVGLLSSFAIAEPDNQGIGLINDSLVLAIAGTSFDRNDNRNGQCPSGVFTIQATFTNSSEDRFFDVFFDVNSSNPILNVKNGNDGVGTVVIVQPNALGDNGILDRDESFTQNFEICLQSLNSFNFFADALATRKDTANPASVTSTIDLVNDSLELIMLGTSFDSDDQNGQCPSGVFTIHTAFKNMSENSLYNVFFDVAEIIGGNTVLNVVNGDGGVGSVIVVQPGALGDEILVNGETFLQDFNICLQSLNNFMFKIDVFASTQ